MSRTAAKVAKQLDKIEDFVDRRLELESMLKCMVGFDLAIETPIGLLTFEGFWMVDPVERYEIFCPPCRDLGVATGETVEEALLQLKRRLAAKSKAWWEKRR